MAEELKNIRALEVGCGKQFFYGASQHWYLDRWMRMSGCGPTAASNIVWYLAQGCQGFADLRKIDIGDREECLELMTDMFSYVKPGIGGVKNPQVFAKGLMRYATERGFLAESKVIRIPCRPLKRPAYEKVEQFIEESLEADRPVAFLNYSKGKLPNLDGWHWVTIVKYYQEEGLATISDAGGKKELSLHWWWRTAFLGGAFVSVRIW